MSDIRECFVAVYDGFLVDKELKMVSPEDALGARVRCFHGNPIIAAEIVAAFAAKNPGKSAKIKTVKAVYQFEEATPEDHGRWMNTAVKRMSTSTRR